MKVNADFSVRAAVHSAALPWLPSPTAGVDRRMLDRIGVEVARATSVVRYAAGSTFPRHTHGGGEEFLVLSGTFQDENGDYPAGTYVRNPPTSSHAPSSKEGCVIFVKLWQFLADDRAKVCANAVGGKFEDRGGVAVLDLFRDRRECVTMERWRPNAEMVIGADGGVEIFVVGGEFIEGIEMFPKQSWLRLPCGSKSTVKSGSEGALVWIKTGHLSETIRCPV